MFSDPTDYLTNNVTVDCLQPGMHLIFTQCIYIYGQEEQCICIMLLFCQRTSQRIMHDE